VAGTGAARETGADDNTPDTRGRFEDWLEIAADGFGNHWVLVIRPGAAARGPVWFACHDPPVVLHIADDLSGFLRHFLDAHRGGGAPNPYACTHRDAMRVWEEKRAWPTAAELREAGDPLVAELIGGLPERAEVIDLRGGGRGFVWERYDTYSAARRKVHALLFGLLPERGKF
jgi:hypothetical protein